MYWTDTLQEHEDINKLTAENAGFGANSAMELETHEKKLDAAMENLVAIMSSDKSQVETLLATNALLAKQLTEKNVTITRLTKEMSNLVNIITKLSGNNHATNNNNKNGNAGKVSFDRWKGKNPDDTLFDPNGYCWTHRYRVHFNHISANCKYKAEVQNTEATRANTIRGMRRNKDWVKGL